MQWPCLSNIILIIVFLQSTMLFDAEGTQYARLRRNFDVTNL